MIDSTEPITRQDMMDMFGEFMPIEAVNLIWNAPEARTVGEMRAELRKIAEANKSKVKTALEFYGAEAEALARHMTEDRVNKSDAILASVTVLSLDGGRRAREAMIEWKDRSK